MEKTRRLKTFSIVALIVAVLGLTIAFAALSKTLTINGTGTVDAANWDIHFKNISEPSLTGKATTIGTPVLADNGATINDMKVSLKEPGDKVVYTVDIENSGDINAEIDSIVLPTFTTAQSNILDFKAVYTSNNKEIATGDILESKEVKNVTITIMYKDITDESLLPKEGININLNYELHFVQTDKASGSSSQGGNNPSSSYGVAIASKQLSDTITATYYGGEEQQDGTYQGGTLVISGTGAIPNQDETFTMHLFLAGVESPDDFTGTIKYNPTNLIIEEGITRIGSNFLSDLNVIKTVSLPEGLESIGERSFSLMYSINGKNGITEITMPSTLKTIGDYAFADQENLSIVNLNEGLESIGVVAFADFAGVSFRIPGTVNYIGHYMFSDAPNLKELYIASESLAGEGSIIEGTYDIEKIYCKTQSSADAILVRNPGFSDLIVVDPSKFE